MEQEVVEKKIIREECFDCKKHYRHLEPCKDGKFRCKRCKKKMVTNKWYDPNWKIKNQYVGRYNMSAQEKSLLMTNKIKSGLNPYIAKRQVNLCMKQLDKNRRRKYVEDKLSLEKQKIEKENKIEQSKKFLEGLGQKKK
jgi:hypothetical protein